MAIQEKRVHVMYVVPSVTADVAFLIPPTADKTAINQK